jgi:uncharacterized spore protein YtfJ
MEETMKEQNPDDPAAATSRPADLMERLIGSADVARVFGEPIRQGDTVMIPAAEVLTVAGFGMGSGSGAVGGPARSPRRGGGGGGGGGGRTLARGVAVIVASPEGVRVHPIVDFTKIALAALTAGGFVWASWRKMSRSGGLLRR